MTLADLLVSGRLTLFRVSMLLHSFENKNKFRKISLSLKKCKDYLIVYDSAATF